MSSVSIRLPVPVFMVAAALTCCAQALPPPHFTADGIQPYLRGLNRILGRGSVVTLWGGHFGAEQDCPAPDWCGVRVMLGELPAELLYVGPVQINFRVPDAAPKEARLPLRVCRAEVCSDPVMIRLSAQFAEVRLLSPAYVRMPVWLQVDAPPPLVASGPCPPAHMWVNPSIRVELRHGGTIVEPRTQPTPPQAGDTRTCDAPGEAQAIPLHLLYSFEEPGEYSVRITHVRDGTVDFESEWTPMQIHPFWPLKRDELLRELGQEAATTSVYQTVASLLAWPDERALAVLMKITPDRKNGCVNYDCIRVLYGAAALRWFDPALVRRTIPPERRESLCRWTGGCE